MADWVSHWSCHWWYLYREDYVALDLLDQLAVSSPVSLGIHGKSAPLPPPPATVDPYVASFDKITVSKFPVMLREARISRSSVTVEQHSKTAVALAKTLTAALTLKMWQRLQARRRTTIHDDDTITKGTNADVVHSPG
ncbi:hypothetical protein V490_00073 [Pseudogymnoascus sp. VKM F-3557]|nr:hypothetical protein V490_00073 [Pseudogymnoascus sp. VKM F-3557]